MSYEIIYNKQFVKLNETEFVPIVLIGSNNCYDVLGNGRQRRERSWYSLKYVLQGKCYGTLATMLATCEKERESHIESNKQQLEKYGESYGAYNDNNYGYYASLAINGSTRRTTFGMYKGIFVDGVKKAMTVEELRENGISIEVCNGYAERETFEKTGKECKSLYPKTSAELRTNIDELEEYYKDTKIGIYVKIDNSPERVKQVQKRIRRLAMQNNPKRVKVQKEVNEYFVVKCVENGGFFVKGIKYGFRYSYYNNYGAKKVYTEKAAQALCKKLNEKHTKEFVIERVVLTKPEVIFA